MNRAPISRELRLPFFVQVESDPALLGCFSSNISSTGIGLVCQGGAEVHKGHVFSFSFPLPGGARVHARGEVMWVFGRPGRTKGGVETAIGLRFLEIAAADRAAFSRFLFDNRYHVTIAFAAQNEIALMREVAGATHHLHFADSEAELHETLSTGEISALVVFGPTSMAPASAVTRVLSRLLEGTGGTFLPSDLLPSVIFCAESAGDELFSLINAGFVYRVLPPPLDAQDLGMALQKACAGRGERTEQARLAEHALSRDRTLAPHGASADARIIGSKGGLETTLARLRRAAPHKVSLLFIGETGAGKEVMATLAHELSPRAQQALVVQDCGALPATLLDSALFGHTKGAFTGAVSDAPGLFVLADGGTVFLDEVENTSAELQAKLLRVIETGEVRPVGGSKLRHTDVRIVAATNRDLGALVKAGSFREDLYYRLNIFPIRVPPLRERREDILPLAHHFLKLKGRPKAVLSQQVISAFSGYGWPGNVRELLNTIEFALIMSEPNEPIALRHLPETLFSRPVIGEQSLEASVRAFERARIKAALEQSAGVLRQAAALLNVHPVTLRRKAIEHGLHARA